MGMVTLRTYDNHINAHLAKTKLESEGIVCYLFDENINTLNPLYNMATGGIKLKVSSEDLEWAEHIISETEVAKHTDEKDAVISCPSCGSDDLYIGFKSMKGIRGFFSVVVSFLLMIFPIYYKTVYKCKSCGHEFVRESRST